MPTNLPPTRACNVRWQSFVSGPPFPSPCPGTLKPLTFRWSLPPAWGGAMREAMSFHGHAALAGSSRQFVLVNPGVSSCIVRDERFPFASVRVYNRTELLLQVESKSDRSIFTFATFEWLPTIRAKKPYYYVACVTNPDMMSCNYKVLNCREQPLANDVSRSPREYRR